MDIAIVTMQLGPGYRHGTERYVETLGSALRRRGHRVRFLAGDPRGRRAPARFGAPVDEAAGIHALPSSGWMAVEGEGGKVVRRWLAEHRPDLVHLANPAHVGVGVVRACARLGIPYVVTTMDFWWVCPRATLLREGAEICRESPGWRRCAGCVTADHPRPALRPLGALALPLYALAHSARGRRPSEAARWTVRGRVLREVLDGAAGVVFPSPALRDRLAPELSHRRWSLIPYGLEPEWHGSPRGRDDKPWDPTRVTIGFAGSLQPHKGADVLVEALRILGWEEARLRIAGSSDAPSYRAGLERRAASLSAEFTGELEAPALRDFLRSLDVLVVPSRWPENLPFVLLEGQAAGVPVIASRVPGMSHRIRDARRLFEPGSAGDLARALADFVSDPGEPPPLRVDTAEEMTAATEAVYRRALDFAAVARSEGLP